MWTFGHIANACTLLYIHRAYPNVYLNCWTHGLLATQYTLTYKFKECILCLICISVQSPGHLDFWTHNKKIEMCLRSNHWTHGPLDTQHTLAYKFIECILCFDIYISVQLPGHLDTQQKTRILAFCNITEFGQKLSLFSFLDFSIFFIFGL